MKNGNGKKVILFKGCRETTPVILDETNATAFHFPKGLDRVCPHMFGDEVVMEEREYYKQNGVLLVVRIGNSKARISYSGGILCSRDNNDIYRQLNQKDYVSNTSEVREVSGEKVDRINSALVEYEKAKKEVENALKDGFAKSRSIRHDKASQVLVNAEIRNFTPPKDIDPRLSFCDKYPNSRFMKPTVDLMNPTNVVK